MQALSAGRGSSALQTQVGCDVDVVALDADIADLGIVGGAD